MEITTEDIMSIDNRITSCYVENADDNDKEFYVKIRFDYFASHIGRIKNDGRQEFLSVSRRELLDDIKKFMLNDFIR